MKSSNRNSTLLDIISRLFMKKNLSIYKKSLLIALMNFIKTILFFVIFKILFLFGSEEDVAIYSLIDSYIILFSAICSFAVQDTSIRLFKDFNGDLNFFLKKYFKYFLISFLIASPFIFLLSRNIDNYYYIYLIVATNMFTNMFVGILRAFNNVLLANFIIFLLSPLLFFGILFLFYINSDFANVYPILLFTKITILLISLSVYLHLKSRFDFPKNDKIPKSISSIAFPIAITHLITSLPLQSTILLLGFFGYSSDLISFKIASKIIFFIVLLRASFYDSLKPLIPKMFSGNEKKGIGSLVYNHNLKLIPIVILYAICVVIFLKPLLFFLNPDNILNHNIILLILLASVLNTLIGPVEMLYRFTSYEREVLYFKIIIISIFLLLSFFTLKFFNPLSLAILFATYFPINNLLLRKWILTKLNE